MPPRPGSSALAASAGILMTLAGVVIFANVVYYALGWLKDVTRRQRGICDRARD